MTSIEWTDATWNPLRGCRRISPGCENCYAERIAARFSGAGGTFEGFALMTAGGPRWTGRVELMPARLLEPLRWREPRRVFVNSMSDLFHEDLEDAAIDRVFAVMAICDGTRLHGNSGRRGRVLARHTFQVLTKRAWRMRRYLSDPETPYRIAAEVCEHYMGFRPTPGGPDWAPVEPWPLTNVWPGVSVEDQRRADERLPDLVETPAARRVVSLEPLLGPVNFTTWRRRLHHVIVGGESGPGARPCDAAWIRSAVRQCRGAGVAVFVKQVGAYVVDRNDRGFDADSHTWADGPDAGEPVDRDAWPEPLEVEDLDPGVYQGAPVRVHLRNRKGGDPSEWPFDLRVREWPEAVPAPELAR